MPPHHLRLIFMGLKKIICELWILVWTIGEFVNIESFLTKLSLIYRTKNVFLVAFQKSWLYKSWIYLRNKYLTFQPRLFDFHKKPQMIALFWLGFPGLWLNLELYLAMFLSGLQLYWKYKSNCKDLSSKYQRGFISNFNSLFVLKSPDSFGGLWFARKIHIIWPEIFLFF